MLAGAHRLALEHGIFERPLGVAGIWGSLIRQWLDDLLPDNALELCRGRVRLVVTEVNQFAPASAKSEVSWGGLIRLIAVTEASSREQPFCFIVRLVRPVPADGKANVARRCAKLVPHDGLMTQNWEPTHNPPSAQVPAFRQVNLDKFLTRGHLLDTAHWSRRISESHERCPVRRSRPSGRCAWTTSRRGMICWTRRSPPATSPSCSTGSPPPARPASAS